MVKYAFLFPGQGAQVPGMIQDVCSTVDAAKKTLSDISDIIGEDISKALWETDAQTLSRSDRSQLCITAASLALTAALKSRGIEPQAVAGFSLGEWSALHVSGVLSFEDTVRTVKKRGEIMQAVCEEITAESGGTGNPPGMAAVIGLDADTVLSLVRGRTDVFAVNMNSTKQTVVAGTDEGLIWCEAACKEANARRFIRLKVAGPFHSPLMQKAADQFAAVLEPITFHEPTIALFSNVNGELLSDPVKIRQNAIKHIISPVLWTKEEKSLYDFIGNDSGSAWKLLETGPGTVLTGLWKDTGYGEHVSCVPCGTLQHLEEVCS